MSLDRIRMLFNLVEENHMLNSLFIALTVFFTVCKFAIGQDLVYTNHTMSDGLPSNEVHDIYQDSRGFMWFATDRGLARYDGTKFKVYREPQGLPSPVLLRFLPENDHKIWIINVKNELFYFDPDAEPVIFHPHEKNELISSTVNKVSGGFHIRNFWEDDEGNINLTTRIKSGRIIIKRGDIREDGIARREDPSGFSLVLHFFDGEISGYAYTRLVADGNNGSMVRVFDDKSMEELNLDADWLSNVISTRGVADLKRNKKGLWILLDHLLFHWKDGVMKSTKLPSEGISLNFSRSDVLIATNKGAYILDLDLNVKKHLLPKEFVTNIYPDKHGGLWLSTIDNGIYHSKSTFISQVTNETNSTAFADMVVDNKHIYAIDRTYLLSVFSKGGEALIEGLSSFKLFDGVIMGVSHSGDQHIKQLGLTEFKGIDHVYDHLAITVKQEIPQKIRSFSRFDFVGTVTDDGVVLDQSYLDIPTIRSSIIASDSAIYLATDGGLFVYEGNSLKEVFPENPLFRERMIRIRKLRKGYLLATRTNGLIFFRGDRIVHLTRKDGLSSNDIVDVLVHSDDCFTVGTYGGLDRFNIGKNLRDLQIHKIGPQHGLPNQKVVSMTSDSDSIWVSTLTGICAFPINAEFEQSLIRGSEFIIDSVLINGNRVSRDFEFVEGGELTYFFTQVCYNYEKPLQFEYRIIGKGGWKPTNGNQLSLSGLRHGTYEVEIRAFAENGDKGPGHKVRFVVLAPFWKEGWFIGFIILTSLILIIIAIRYSNKRAIRKKQADLEKVKLEMKALLAQMNPHFTFNTISSIQHYIIKKDTAAALDYLSEFAELIRRTLDFSRRDRISLQDDILFLESYIQLEQKRFDYKFEFRLENNCKTPLREIQFPPLLIQPLLENAIIHGVSHLKEGGLITLSLSEDNSFLEILLTDNGLGLNDRIQDTSDHKSYGIDIVRERLRLYNGGNYEDDQLIINKLSGKLTGVEVKIKVWIYKNKEL